MPEEAPADRATPWLTPTSSRSAPAAARAAAPAAPGRPRPRATWRRDGRQGRARQAAASRPPRRQDGTDRPEPDAKPAPPSRPRRARRRARADADEVAPPPADAGRPPPTGRRAAAPQRRHPGRGLARGRQARRAGGLRRRLGAPPRRADWRSCAAGSTGDYDVDEYGFDPELTERFFMAALRPLAEKWFRVEVRGLENIPAEGGALVVSNHSGTVPLDGLMTMLDVHDHADRFLRPLGADLVFKLPFVSALARKGGATLACTEDAERMLSGGELVGVWPEGFKGIGKPFSERYKLQRFGRGGFVSAALRTGVPDRPAARSWAPRRSTRSSATCRRWRGCSACPTSRSRRSSRGSARSAWCRCRRSGSSSSASRSAPTPTTPARPRTRCWSSTSPTRCARPSSRRCIDLLRERGSVFC